MAISTVIIALLISGCVSSISALHDGPIEQDPGSLSLGTTIDDNTLETIAEVNIGKASTSLNESHIVAVVYNGEMLLIGQVPTEKDKLQAGMVAKKVRGIKKVFNELEIRPNTSYLTRSSDAWLTSKIKGKMVAEKDFPSGKVKVITENSIVYLMGIVHRSVADKAIAIARSTDGVQKVITAFDYLK